VGLGGGFFCGVGVFETIWEAFPVGLGGWLGAPLAERLVSEKGFR